MSRFDEEPDADPHGECAAEIHKLQNELKEVLDVLSTLVHRVEMSIDSDILHGPALKKARAALAKVEV